MKREVESKPCIKCGNPCESYVWSVCLTCSRAYHEQRARERHGEIAEASRETLFDIRRRAANGEHTNEDVFALLAHISHLNLRLSDTADQLHEQELVVDQLREVAS